MVGVAQLVEHQIVVLDVAGSIPVAHPNLLEKTLCVIEINSKLKNLSGRGAIGSALALGARGCQFESGRPDHFFLSMSARSSGG